MSFVRRLDNVECPSAKESGVALRAPVVLVVSISDDAAFECELVMAELDVGFVRVAQGIAACRAIQNVRPTVVALGSSLWSDEIRAIGEAARQVGARVVELPPFAPSGWIATTLLDAALGDASPSLSAAG